MCAVIGCVDVPAFWGASSFNGDLSSWDTSSVTTFAYSTAPPALLLSCALDSDVMFCQARCACLVVSVRFVSNEYGLSINCWGSLGFVSENYHLDVLWQLRGKSESV